MRNGRKSKAVSARINLFPLCRKEYPIKKQGCWHNEMKPTRLQLSRDLKPEKTEALGRRDITTLYVRQTFMFELIF